MNLDFKHNKSQFTKFEIKYHVNNFYSGAKVRQRHLVCNKLLSHTWYINDIDEATKVAAMAIIRHKLTPYDFLLEIGRPRKQCRNIVRSSCNLIFLGWKAQWKIVVNSDEGFRKNLYKMRRACAEYSDKSFPRTLKAAEREFKRLQCVAMKKHLSVL